MTKLPSLYDHFMTFEVF